MTRSHPWTLGVDTTIDCDDIEVGPDVVIGDRCQIRARRIRLGPGVHIDDDVRIDVEELVVGAHSKIEARCLMSAMGGQRCRLVKIGEHSLFSHDCKSLLPVFVVGDHTAIHNHTICNGRKPMVIGHNSWFGQNCMLNAEESLTIGNHVGVGAYSSVYTHGYFGDLLEGCQVFKVGSVNIEDDVWILGSYNIISPGVTLGEKSLILTGSLVTRDVPANHSVGGSPARDMTDRLVPYVDSTAVEKLDRVRGFVLEFVTTEQEHSELADGFDVPGPQGYALRFVRHLGADTELPETRPLVVYAATIERDAVPTDVTVFDLENRRYFRVRSDIETRLMRFLRSYRARFVPADEPRVRVPERFEPTEDGSSPTA